MVAAVSIKSPRLHRDLMSFHFSKWLGRVDSGQVVNPTCNYGEAVVRRYHKQLDGQRKPTLP